MLLVLTACSEFAILMSGSSLAVSQNAYSKAYSTIDFLTVVSTEKDIKTHFYESVIKYDRRK
jgi:hypothetical protein